MGASHFHQSVAGLTVNELPHAAIAALVQFARRSVEDDLRFAFSQPGNRHQHHDAVRDFARRPHIVRDDDAGDGVLGWPCAASIR